MEVNITRKLQVDITPGFLLLTAAFTVLMGVGRALMVFAAVAVHEMGHLACLLLYGARVEKLRLTFGGAEIVFDDRLSYAGEILAALSGPFAGALLAAGSLGAGEVTGHAAAYELAAVSAMYTFFNLLPASPMDGGRALAAFSALLFGPDVSQRVSMAADILCVLAFFGGGIYVCAVTRGNCTLLICAFFLANACCKKSRFGVE